MAVMNGEGALVDPREEITIQTPERRRTGGKKDVDDKVGRKLWLISAREIIDYQPARAAGRLYRPRSLLEWKTTQ